MLLCTIFADVSVFTAVRGRVLVGENEIIPWEVIIIDTSGGFDSSKSIFTVPESGLYLTHFSAGFPAYTPMKVSLGGTTNSPNILMTETVFNGEMMTSRDDIQWWGKGQQVYLSSNYTLNSDGMFQTSWSAVRIDNIMTSVVAFCLARTSDLSGRTNYPLPFTKAMLAVGGALEICIHRFIAPTDGTYFISFSVAMRTYSSSSYIRTFLRVGLYYTIRSMIYLGSSTSNYENDIASNSILLPLRQGDIVDLTHESESSYDHYSDEHYQTALLGFLYEPVHGYKIAWSATCAATTTFTGPIAAFPFNLEWLNDGGVWNTSSYTGIIPVSGIYWLKLSGASPFSTSSQFNMILLVNSQPIINVMEKITNGGNNVRSHSIAFRLKQGDQLQVSVPTGFQVYTPDYSACFLGFLIFPDL